MTVNTVLTPLPHELLLATLLRHISDFCWIWECAKREKAVALALVC